MSTEHDQDQEQSEDTGAAAATPPIGEDAEKEQTQHEAPEDDVGVPPQDELEDEDSPETSGQ